MRARARRAGPVIVLSEDGEVLLLRGGDPRRPQDGTWWFTPGGGVDGDESTEEAARRELREETGLLVDMLGPVVLRRHAEFEFEGARFVQEEDYFVACCPRFEVTDAGWTDVERRVIEEHRWWPAEELRATKDTVYPEGLVEFVSQFHSTLPGRRSSERP